MIYQLDERCRWRRPVCGLSGAGDVDLCGSLTVNHFDRTDLCWSTETFNMEEIMQLVSCV